MIRRSGQLIHILLCVIVLFVVAAAGLTSLPQPFDGDQALFAMGAEQWVSGEIYFRDFWDLKPPGIYLFYVVAGLLCGFDEVGIHLFELLWSMSFAVLLARGTRRWYQTGIARATVPLITVGVYYCIADTWHLTQIEWIVAFPLVVSLLCMSSVTAKEMPSISAFLVAGFCGGLVGLCKPMYGLIPAIFWCVAILLNPAGGWRDRLTFVISRGAAFAGGVVIPLAAAAWYFQIYGVLDVALRTMFEYPARVLAQKHDGYGMLLQGLKWCALMAGPMMALALAGATLAVRTGKSSWSVSLVTWLVAGLILVFAQGMWWEYHYLLILTPMGLLALKAIETIILQLEQLQPRIANPSNRLLVAVCIFMAFSVYPASLITRTAWLQLYGFAIEPADRLAWQSVRHLEYQKAFDETRFLHDTSSSRGDIYVFGNPITYRFAGRHQAIPQQGWSIKVYLPEQWTVIEEQLATSKPAYVFVAANKKEHLQDRGVNILDLLNRDYRILRQSANGTWHERNPLMTESLTVQSNTAR